jgi:integrase
LLGLGQCRRRVPNQASRASAERFVATHDTPPMDKLLAFDVIRNARALIKDVNTSAGERTVAQYRAGFARMTARGLTPEKIANTQRSFYFYRAAFVQHFAALIRDELRTTDKAQKGDDEKRFAEGVGRLGELTRELERYRPDPNSTHLDKGVISKWAVEVEKRAKSGFKALSHSKRSRLRGLPANWREKMFAVSENSKYRDALAALGVIGARPAEFENGVLVQINDKGNLTFTIKGVKTHGGKYGQETRVLEIEPKAFDAQYLANRVRETGEFVIQAKAGALSDRVREFSKVVFPKLESGVSAYVYRHQFSADLKASGLSDVDVSTALGHSIDETKRFYGAAQSGRHNPNVKSVKGSRRVREKTQEKIRELDRSKAREFNFDRER